MSDFSAESLVTLAKARYGESILQSRIAGAQGDADLADAELLLIAKSVLSKVESSLRRSIGWPLVGNWPHDSDFPDTPFREQWPYDLEQQALRLFNGRTLEREAITPEQLRVMIAAEKYFDDVAAGKVAVNIGGATDAGQPIVMSTRNRDGTSNLPGTDDGRTMFDQFAGLGYDRMR